MINQQQILTHRPVGMPTSDTWTLTETEVPALKEGEVLIRNHYVSLDPAMRGWMNDARSYIPPVQLGEVMRAGTVGEVIKANNHPQFKVGDVLSGWGGVQEYTVTDGANYYQVDTRLAPMPTSVPYTHLTLPTNRLLSSAAAPDT